MPTDAEKWKQDMINRGLLKDDQGYYHYVKSDNTDDVWLTILITY